ncbi:MAG: HDOD domain-containing protein, partial [Planctomycetota bacterium]
MPDSAAILRHVDALPALPVVVSEILARTQEAEPHTDFVVDLVESDPAILAAVMKSAQRSARASRATHDKLNAERAVSLLGFAQLRRLALSMGVIKTFDQLPDAGGIGRGDFWTHSMAVACAAELIAKQSGVT